MRISRPGDEAVFFPANFGFLKFSVNETYFRLIEGDLFVTF